MLKKLFVRSLIGLGGVGLMTATAVAGVRVTNGNICHQLSTTGTLVRSSGAIHNDSTSGVLSVTCPVVRENPGANIAAAQISFDVLDRSGVSDVTCQFINEIVTISGLGVAQVASATSTGVNQAGVANIPTTTQSTSHGSTQYSHVYCVLPAKVVGSSPSYVARIWMNEP